MIFGLLDYDNLAATLNSGGRYEEALVACEMGLRMQPSRAPLHANRARALVALEREDEGLAACDAALALDPECTQAHVWRAFAYESLGEHALALEAARAAVRTAPESEEAHCTLATVLLWNGHYVEGLREQEWHWRREAELLAARFSAAPWDGERSPRLRLLVVHEQGSGDFIQVARYFPALRERVGRIAVETSPELADLLRTVAGVDEIVLKGTPVEAGRFDAYARLMSVPRILGSEPATIPRDVPYLQADPARVAAWKARLGPPSGRRIGLVWSGNPAHTDDRSRSIDVTAFGVLASVPDVRWFSLQKGARENDPAPANMALERLGPQLATFADTAALLCALDLVITVDTSVAHLSGALGRPVWMLLPRLPDWRWLREGAGTPWYPTMRLFRRGRGEGWDAVVARIGAALSSA